MAGLNALALFDQVGQHIAVERRRQDDGGVRLDLAHQPDLVHQRVGLYGQPLFACTRLLSPAALTEQGAGRAGQQQEQGNGQQGFFISSH